MIGFDMPRSTRFFEIIQLLRGADKPITAQKIAEVLEVTQRTIYRDMAALQAMRLPIEGEAGIGYIMRSGYDLPPLMFTQDEVEAIMVGLSLIGRTGDAGLERSARSVVLKLADVLPDAAQMKAPIRVSKWNAIPKPMVSVEKLRKLIRDELELSIIYLDLKNHRTTRVIKPLAIVYYIDAVLLAAWCDLRHGFRHFRVDRIEKCTSTGTRFTGQSAELLRQWEQKADLP